MGQSNKKYRHDIVLAGMALFAMFLGAANIIFPPFLGAAAGDQWVPAGLGFLLTGVGLPVLGIIATANAGGQALDLGKRVSPGFSILLNIMILIFIGPLFALPRTAATTIELAVVPFLPKSWNSNLVLPIGCAIFFLICLIFVLNPSDTLDKISKFFTPVLVVFLTTLILIAIFDPPGEPVTAVNSLQTKGAFPSGFSTGYQTMDALGAIVFCTTVYNSIHNKGWQREQIAKMLIPTSLIAGVGLFFVYGGFIWIGAAGSSQLQGIAEYSTVTVKAVELLAANVGNIMLAVIIAFACVTTGIGLLVTACDFFFHLFKEKVSYRVLLFLNIMIAYGIAILGVDKIIKLAEPCLAVIYPIVIILVILNLFNHKIKYNFVFTGSLIAACPFILLDLLTLFDGSKDLANTLLAYVPLSKQGFGSLLPAFLGAIIGSCVASYLDKKGKLSPKHMLHSS